MEEMNNPDGAAFNLTGVWAFSATSAYAVGRDGEAADANGVLLKLNGSTWTRLF